MAVPNTGRRTVLAALTGGAVVAIVAVLSSWLAPVPEPQPRARLTVSLSSAYEVPERGNSMDLSPDGRTLALVGCEAE